MSKVSAEGNAAENTDRELWREREGDYYADSLHVTKGGGIGMDCGGHVIVMPIRKWHAMARELLDLRAKAAAGKWVAVKEGLPECSKKRDSFGVAVIVFRPANKNRKVFEAFYGRRVSNEPNFYLYGAFLDGIECWQYLPAAPEAEKP